METYLKNIFKYAIQLHLIESIENEEKREALLKLEPDFKRSISKLEEYLNNDPRKDFLVFVANREDYTLEERVRIGQQFINELDNN